MKQNSKRENRKIVKTDEDYDCSLYVGPGSKHSPTRITAGTNAETLAKMVMDKIGEINNLKLESNILANAYLTELKRGIKCCREEVSSNSLIQSLADLTYKRNNGEDFDSDTLAFRSKMFADFYWSAKFRETHKISLEAVFKFGSCVESYCVSWKVDWMRIETTHPIVGELKFLDLDDFREIKYAARYLEDRDGNSWDRICEDTYDYRHLFNQIEAFVKRHEND